MTNKGCLRGLIMEKGHREKITGGKQRETAS